MPVRRGLRLFPLSLLLLPILSFGQLQLSNIFSANMVLQRNAPIRIWGKAVPGRMVTVSFARQCRQATVQQDSAWSVSFQKQKENARPQSLFIACGDEKIELQNILVGDVWLCSGQSNMEWPVQREMHWKEESRNAHQSLVRLNNPPPAGRNVYGVAYTDSLNRRLTTDSFYAWHGWDTCDSNTVKDMSAVGYYFAKRIVAKEGIPIGLINLSIGGAPLETFISRDALQNDKRFAAKVRGDWLRNEQLPGWIRERGKQNVGNHPEGYKDDLGLNHAYKPGFAYESGVKPLLNFPIKGVLWYQGESNSLEKERVDEYKDLLHLLIDDYRRKWKQPDMPFYWVQLSSIDTATYSSQYWPQFRDGQRRLLNEVKRGGMAVCSDIGFQNNVHPTNKKDVGERLARWALQQVYGEDIVPSGPLPLNAVYDKGKIIVTFRYARHLRTADGNGLRGFSLDGKTGAAAAIVNDRVVIHSEQRPAFLYYGWKPFTDANLVNDEGLPASTFKLKINDR